MIFFLITFGIGVTNFTICSLVSRAKIMRHDHTGPVSFVAGTVMEEKIVAARDAEQGKPCSADISQD